jgi:hypothetical protein
MKIEINQHAGLGDILFLEPILRKLAKNNEVIMPVVEPWLWQKHIPYVNFTNFTFQFDGREQKFTSDYYPFRYANPIYRGYDLNDWHDFENCMLDKYRVLELPLDMWLGLSVVRDYENEARLIKLLNLPEKFILVNEYSRVGVTHIKLEGNTPIIYMRPVEGFSVIDWCGVMELAVENHHVSTSTFYLLHMLGLDAKIYPRPDGDGLKGISQLLPMTRLVGQK